MDGQSDSWPVQVYSGLFNVHCDNNTLALPLAILLFNNPFSMWLVVHNQNLILIINGVKLTRNKQEMKSPLDWCFHYQLRS